MEGKKLAVIYSLTGLNTLIVNNDRVEKLAGKIREPFPMGEGSSPPTSLDVDQGGCKFSGQGVGSSPPARG